jgi:hypothetical protein
MVAAKQVNTVGSVCWVKWLSKGLGCLFAI